MSGGDVQGAVIVAEGHAAISAPPWRRTYGLLCFVVCVGLLAGVTPSGAAAAEFRVEAGLGVAHGDHKLASSRNLDAVGLSVESNSAINGSGIAVTIGAWADGLLFKNLSFGLEYLHIENSADLDLAVEALDETVSVDSGADLDMDALMLNAAWRQNRGTIPPTLRSAPAPPVWRAASIAMLRQPPASRSFAFSTSRIPPMRRRAKS